MKKFGFILILLIFFIAVFLLKTADIFQDRLEINLDNVIEKSSLKNSAVISISIRKANTGKTVYKKNSKLLLHPASTLKAFTTPVMINYLGSETEIKTAIYYHNNNFYLKLSGDPLLKDKELFELFKKLKNKGIVKIQSPLIIDDTEIDDIPWGIGWMWDDENNPYMPKYNIYNLENNLVTIKVKPGKQKLSPSISIKPYFPVKIINNAVTSNKNEIKIERRSWLDSEAIYVEGEIKSAIQKKLPVANPKKMFIYRLKQAINANGIKFNGKIQNGELPPKAVLKAKISHKVKDIVYCINKKSDNLAAETLFKITGAKISGKTGTTNDGVKAFERFYKKIGADPSKLLIADGSGVSHNNLITVEWMSLALGRLQKHIEFDIYKNSLASPGKEGTLKTRMLDLSGKLWAKTGTLAGISGITGYLEVASGELYSFAILIQNFKGDPKTAKNFEDEILTTVMIH